MDDYIPDRGDAIWLDFNPQKGREHSGRRPALVLSPKAYNKKVGLALMCPITGQVKIYPFEVTIPDDLAVKGVILADQVKSLDWRVRNADYICKLPESVVTAVLQKLETLLGVLSG